MAEEQLVESARKEFNDRLDELVRLEEARACYSFTETPEESLARRTRRILFAPKFDFPVVSGHTVDQVLDVPFCALGKFLVDRGSLEENARLFEESADEGWLREVIAVASTISWLQARPPEVEQESPAEEAEEEDPDDELLGANNIDSIREEAPTSPKEVCEIDLFS